MLTLLAGRHPERDGTWAHCARAINMLRAIDAFELLVMIVKTTVIEHQKTDILQENKQSNRIGVGGASRRY